jgi:hypothetical protein
MLSANAGWAVGAYDTKEEGVVLRYDGASWQVQRTFTETERFTSIAMWPDGTGYAGDEDSRIWHFDGQTWQVAWDGRDENHPSEAINDIALSGPKEGWAVIDHGPVARLQNGEWVFAPTPVGLHYTDSRPASVSLVGDDGWMALHGHLLRWR